MADENKEQQSEQEQEPVQGEDPAQETEERDEPARKKGEGLLMPFLYALLAAVGAFTLVMIIGIVVTFVTRPPEDPSETPSALPSSQVTTAASPDVTESQAPEGPGGEDADSDVVDTPE